MGADADLGDRCFWSRDQSERDLVRRDAGRKRYDRRHRYSYERGGTELGLFDIDQYGKLGYRATYHLRSNDYYSSRNYASA
jgi:hypothetical protein